MNYKEEQESELEALSEIYYNEINVISKKQPISFSIKIRSQASTDVANFVPKTDDQDDDDDDEEDSENDYDSNASDDYNKNDNHQPGEDYIRLKFKLPSKYPDEKPSIEVLDFSGISPEQKEELLDKVDATASESLGTVMVFTIVNEIIEWLINLQQKETASKDLKTEKLETGDKRSERKRFEGTPVTAENFLQWKAKFDAEIIRRKFDEQTLQDQGNAKRMTGREMFETDKTLAESDLTFVEDLDQAQLEALMVDIDEDDLDADIIDDEEEDEEDDDSDERSTASGESNK